MGMVQRPSAVGLILCRMVIVEEKTRNVTLANSFQRLAFESLPATPEPFCVYTILTDGLGDIVLDLVVSRCDTLEEIYTRSFQATFRDPLRQLRLWWRVRSCSFPVSGPYEVGLRAGGETIAQSVVEIVEKGTSDA
jgi:hypothetical protein